MSPYQVKQKDKKRKNLFRKWHRWIGFSSAIFLLNLAITGILLNHSDDLKLQDRYVSSNWLVNWYGIKAPANFDCVTSIIKSDLLCQIGEQIFKNNTPMIKTSQPLIGIIQLNDLQYIATKNEIHILTTNFQLVETLNSISGLPHAISEIGILSIKGENTLAVKNQHSVWMYSQNENSWKLTEQSFHSINTLIAPPSSMLIQLKLNYLDSQISYLKLVQDIHSGRILSLSGKVLTDLSGVIIILLSISGFIAWQRRTKQ